jgi:hypothetical protein
MYKNKYLELKNQAGGSTDEVGKFRVAINDSIYNIIYKDERFTRLFGPKKLYVEVNINSIEASQLLDLFKQYPNWNILDASVRPPIKLDVRTLIWQPNTVYTINNPMQETPSGITMAKVVPVFREQVNPIIPHSDSDKISNLLEFGPDIGPKIRNIDTIIHRWKENPLFDVIYDITDFLNHQEKLILLSEGNERRIFNDERVHNGKTGSMTDLLRACYFKVYLHMIQIGLEYSERDFLILINLIYQITYNSEFNNLVMPESEFNCIKELLKIFKRRFPILAAKYRGDILLFRECITKLYDKLPTWTWWQENPDKRNSKELYSKSGCDRWHYGIWESHPYYMDFTISIFSIDRNITLEWLSCVEKLFNDPDSATCVDILSTSMIGGNVNKNIYYKKYLKYKLKYLNLKNN